MRPFWSVRFSAYSNEYPLKLLVLREITVIETTFEKMRDPRMNDYEKIDAYKWKQEYLARLEDDFHWP